MKSTQILFSGLMVRALLAGTKTQTRRIMNPQPRPEGPCGFWFHDDYIQRNSGEIWKYPYGRRGDVLWVREAWAKDEHGVYWYRADADEDGAVPYLMNGDGGFGCGVGHYRPMKWKPSIFMSRWASRITLEITDVRVERLQNISEEDANAEGVSMDDPVDPVFCARCQGSGLINGGGMELDCRDCNTAVKRYASLWDSLNGKKAPWASNCFVWVIEFKRNNP